MNTYSKSLSGVKRRKSKYILTALILLTIVIALCIINLCIGEKNYSFLQVLKTITGVSKEGTYIIAKLRFPRMLTAVLCGIAFGVAGNIFQTLLNNPLASPDIIGVSQGSTVAAVYCILFLNLNRNIVSVISVVAGILVAVLIYRISYLDKFSSGRLILVGIGFQAFFTALINWMVMKAAEYDVPTAMRWMNGNLNGIVTDSLPLLALVVIICLGTIIVLNHAMQSLVLGEQFAIILGVRVNFVRTLLMVCSVILIAFSTAISGPISSIAFLSGPIAGKICGRSHSNIVTSGLIGAILVLGGDFIGQNLLFTRYPVGVITGILGAPYLIYLLISQRKLQ
ncbi:FecCD family ABC transporter permease [Butyrivibrio sp. WCE2006]|uniref:FecCD family ABC transporter permease n=1 Tax=Butyrivibrio sp. WCE2006 TaxID=1410611 RepID=UPI0005D22144|nr:iron ABC transporter permease [Butyrivibrio sp. WCE2006]